MSQNKRTCAIGIDMGARNTGVFFTIFDQSEAPSAERSYAMTLVTPKDGDKITFSQAARTAVRHRLRGKKRFSLARRLLWQIVEPKVSDLLIDAHSQRQIREALNGLLKRRGYARTESELDLTILEKFDYNEFSECPGLDTYFPIEAQVEQGRNFADRWENFTASLEKVKALYHDDELPDVKAFMAYVESRYTALSKAEKNDFKCAYQLIRQDAKNIVSLELMGHKHRLKYLEAIRHDMARDSRLSAVAEKFGGVDNLWRLVGNISNLQLRAERWYFNAPTLMREPEWSAERLQKTLVRAFKYFHPQDCDRQRLQSLIETLEKSDDIVLTLCTLDPALTIPVYEDQNNRRPPVDQTLLLSPTKLTAHYGKKWQVWTERLCSDAPELLPTIESIETQTDRKSRLKVDGRIVEHASAYRFSYALQRAFDRSKVFDKFALRALSLGLSSQRLTAAKNELMRVIGEQHVEDFLNCARRYFDEVAAAKIGLWSEDTSFVLERSDIHPPMKAKILPLLVANVLQTDEKTGQRFMESVWNERVTGRSTVRSICSKIEDVRKRFGGEFNLRYREALLKRENRQKLDSEESELVKLASEVGTAAAKIADLLNLPESQAGKFANPYILAQLYTLIETDRAGFSSTTLAVHRENAWRMCTSEAEFDGTTVTAARCSRLPADSVRPFDGVIRRVLERQSWEIARRVAETIKSDASLKNCTIELPIFIEENSFEFSASLADLKQNTRAKKAMESKAEKLRARWQSKDDRIKSASRGLCPYTGKAIGNFGEIDHIIPRSGSRKNAGVVFNAEPNLIFVSQEGNQRKKDSIYHLSDLDKNYLRAVFGTDREDEIEKKISSIVIDLQKNGRLKYFDLLNDEERDCLRHALFLRGGDVKDAVLDMLETQRRARVNGTQLWMIRCLVQKLKAELNEWCEKHGNNICFDAMATNVMDAKRLRASISELDASFTKETVQPVASHSIDALCALATGISDRGRYHSSGFDFDNKEHVYGIYPSNCEIVRIEAKSRIEKRNIAGSALFKEGIYAEHYLPVFTLHDRVFIGYPNKVEGSTASVEVLSKKGVSPTSLLTLLAPFFDRELADFSSHTVYQIDPGKAAELLTKAALEDCSELELEQADALDALRYCTTKKSVAGLLMAPNGKSLKKRDSVFKADAFVVKVELKSKNLKIKDSLTLPLKADWAKVLNDDRLAERYGRDCSAQELDEILLGLMNRKISDKIRHRAVRRVFSLPVPDSPSGGVRVTRRTINQEAVRQVHAINGLKIRGFKSENGKVDWKQTAKFEELNHPNLIEFEARFKKIGQTVCLNQWRLIYEEAGIKIWLAPGTEGRRYVRIEAPFALVQTWFETSVENWRVQNSQSLPGSFKVKDTDAYSSALGEKLAALVGVPRSEIFVEQVGMATRFRYIVNGAGKAMNDAYNQAVDQ